VNPVFHHHRLNLVAALGMAGNDNRQQTGMRLQGPMNHHRDLLLAFEGGDRSPGLSFADLFAIAR